MSLEKTIEVFALLLILAASLRAVMAVMVLAGHNFATSRHQRKKREQFRIDALRLFEQFGRQEAHYTPEALDKHDQGKRKFKIIKRVQENLTGDVCSFYLAHEDGGTIPAYKPGQHLTFDLSIPGQAQPVVRCYSLSETPTSPQNYYRVTIKKQIAPINSPSGTPNGVSSCFFHNQLSEGDIVIAAPPAGSFCLNQTSDRPIALIAGGVGLTPLLSMMNWLAATRSQREVWLFYGVRNRSEHAFYDHLRAISQSIKNIRIVIFYSHPTQHCRRGIDYHVPGLITTDILASVLKSQNYEFYLCGPPPMMQSISRGLSAWGVAAVDIHTENFGARKLRSAPGNHFQNTDTQESAKSLSGEKFQIHFARSKKTVPWTRRNGTLLDLAEACGVNARCSCRAGQCGTCKVALKTGEIDYIKAPQTEPGAGFCLPCVTYPKSDLVLDL